MVKHLIATISAFATLSCVTNAMNNHHQNELGKQTHESDFGNPNHFLYSNEMPQYPHETGHSYDDPHHQFLMPQGVDPNFYYHDGEPNSFPGMDYSFDHLGITGNNHNQYYPQDDFALPSYQAPLEVSYPPPTHQFSTNRHLHQNPDLEHGSSSSHPSQVEANQEFMAQNPQSSQENAQYIIDPSEIEDLSDLEVDILNRHGRFNKFQWQRGLFKSQIMKIYATIAPLWRMGTDLKRNTLVLRIKKLNEALENNPSLVADILNDHQASINSVADTTRQYRILDRARENKPDRIMTIPQLLTWLETPPNFRQFNGRVPLWAPPDMKPKLRQEITEALSKHWDKHDTTVRNYLMLAKQEDPTIIKDCLPRLISNDPLRFKEAADLLKNKMKIAKSKKAMEIKAKGGRRRSNTG